MNSKGFFAYPNHKRTSDTISAFCDKVNGAGLGTIETWEQMLIGGKILITEICKKIDDCDFLCADITRLNPNVLFEIGYGIAKKKRIWLIRDTTIPSENSDFKQFKILTTLGYREYINSNDIVHAYYKDLPHEHLSETVYDEIIEPSFRFQSEQHVLYLKASYEDEASIKVTQHLDGGSGSNTFNLLIDDPRESPIQPLGWYAKNIYSAHAVICHLTATEREHSKIQNAKHSLAAGLAFGFDIPLLLLIENELLGPTDYRDLLFTYHRAKDAVSKVQAFVAPIITDNRKSAKTQEHERSKKRNVDELALLQIGEPIAEHEEDRLTESSFIETGSYKAALNGSQAIFVGRKGVGKTANFKRLSSVLNSDKRIVVCEISPVSYELEALVAVAKKFELISKKGFLFESLWKFLIYSEIAKQVCQDIESRMSGQIFPNERALIGLVEKRASLLKLDFSARLDTLSADLLQSSLEDNPSSEVALSVSEILHSGIIKELIDAIVQALDKKIKICVLIDNLDKAWDKGDNTRLLCYFFLGLLSALRRIANDIKNHPRNDNSLQLALCVFVRADIFEMVLQEAREPDKIQYQRIVWDDKERLRLLADNRLLAAVDGIKKDVRVEDVWKRFFAGSIFGQDIFDFIFTVILKRPRDLLYFLRSAISWGVSRRHEIVSEDDFLKAEEDYSDFVYQVILVELREKIPQIEDVLIELMGSDAVLTELDIRKKIIDKNRGDLDFNSIIAALCINSFLEIYVPGHGFSCVADEKEYVKYYRAATNISEKDKKPILFRIHRAFWKALVIQENSAVSN